METLGEAALQSHISSLYSFALYLLWPVLDCE